MSSPTGEIVTRGKGLLSLLVAGVGMVVGLAFLGFALVAAGLGLSLPLVLLVMLFYGWMLFAYLHYRQGRQDEMLHLLSTAAEAQVPLSPALWAYLDDRPQGPLREFWTALLLFFVFPGYYWIWHRRHCYDSKVARVAYFLEMGEPLPNALRAAPGVVSPEMTLAIRIGEHSGRLASCLRSSLPKRLAPVWLEMLPRFLYPLLLLLFISGITGFWMVWILPKMERIYADFGLELPEATQRILVVLAWLPEVLPLVILGLAGLGACLFMSSTLRWYLPGVAQFYRRQVQSHVLKMLAVLLGTGTPVPTALGLLSESEYFAPVVRRRLYGVSRRVAQGETLGDSLRQERLVPAAFVPLLQAAERVNNLPWALTELGETLADRTVRSLRRISQVLSPLFVLAVGLFVGLIVVGMFMPLIDIITRLAE